MTAIKLRDLEFEGQGVRMTVREDEPWFVAADVCRVLDIQKPENAFARLDDDEKDTHSVGTLGGVQRMTIINESGLYSLILTSRKPAAKRFKKWVTAEVLPTLRRTGAYVMTPDDEDLPSLADGKVFGMKVAKVNAAARLISVANAIYGPEAARALWESETGLPPIAGKSISSLVETAEDDPVGCMMHLLRVAAGNGRSVRQVLSLAIHDRLAARFLPEAGMALDPSGHKGFLAIASRHEFLAEAFGQTQWRSDWMLALMQLPGAKSGSVTIGTRQSCVLLPRKTVLSLLAGVH